VSAESDALENQLQLLLAERDILRVIFQYALAIDTGDEDSFVDCFTPDGTWESIRRNGVKKFVSGSAELRRFAEVHTRAPESYHKHIVTNSRLTVSGDSASALSYWIRVDAFPESYDVEATLRARTPVGPNPFVLAMGTYTDTFRKCPDGRWRISSRFADRQE
jgi:ketosteroid isomerase-like protein